MVHTQEGPSYIFVPNLKRIAQFLQKLFTGSQNLEIRSRDLCHVQLWVVLWPVRTEGRSSMSVPNLIKSHDLGGQIAKLGHVNLSHAHFET